MELLSGNEAIAQGAWEAGARIGVAYPGTPSTETLEAFAKKDGVYAEWCVNEKVAVEVGIGASAGGARVLSTMKHVGVNVAADPLFTAAYTGVGGGFVVLAADDPGMYSSQNEQDSHYYACAAHIPMLDPADSAEALAFTRDAFGAIRCALLHPLFGARLAYEDAGRGRVPKRGRARSLREQPCKVGHDARVREAAPQGAARAHRGALRMGRDLRVQPGRKAWRQDWRRVRRRCLPACAGGSARCVRVQTWMYMAASQKGVALVCRER